MGNSVEKQMHVGVSANVADFNKAMKTMAQHIGFAEKATRELSQYMRALQEINGSENLTAEQTAVVMDRLSTAMDKYRKQVDKAIQSQNTWLAGLRRINSTSLAIQARDPFAAGLAAMQRQDAARAEAAERRRQLAAMSRTGPGLGRQSFLSELDSAAAATNARESSRAALARTGPNLGRQSFFSALDDATAITNARESNRDALQQQGASFMSQFNTPQQNMRAQLQEAESYFKKGALSAEQYATAVMKIRDQHSFLNRSFGMVKDSILTMVGPLVIAYQSFQFLTDSVAKFMDLERNTARMSTFLGGTAGATSMLADIRAFTREAPVSFESAQRAVSTMLQFGVAASEVVPALKSIAEITGGDQMRMESLALAFAQSQAAGRLMGQELLQMVNAGFNPLKVISDQTGVSLVDLKRQMEDGAVSSEMVAQAFKDATAAGGQFHGLLQNMADTSAGSMTRFKNTIDEVKIAIGGLISVSQRDGFNQISSFIGMTLGTANSTTTNSQRMFRAALGDDRSITELLMDFEGRRDSAAMAGYMRMSGRATSTEDQQQALVDYVRAIGVENVNDSLKAAYDNGIRYLEELKTVQGQQNSIIEGFTDAIKTQQDQFISNVYGDNAPLVALLRGTAGDRTGAINALIDQEAPYEAILAAASETAQAEANRLQAMMDLNAEFENHKKGQEELAKFQKEQEKEQERTQKQQADARKRAAEQFKSEAERIQAKYDPSIPLARLMAMQQSGLITQAQFEMERSSLFSDSGAAARSISAPTAVQGGSAEIATIIANLQVQAVSEQQRLADRAFRVQEATAKATGKVAGILDEIKDDLTPGMAP